MVQQIKLPHPLKGVFEQDEDVLLALFLFTYYRDEIRDAKVGIAYVIKNQMTHPRWWGKDLSSVIRNYGLKDSKEILFPFRVAEPEVWDECFLIAQGVLNETITNPIDSCDTFFHEKNVPKRWYALSRPGVFFCKLGNINFYNVELKNG